jgi:hypothetical protein
VLVIVHLVNPVRVEFVKKARGFRKMEFGVASLDAKKEPIRRGVDEAMYIENRMMRLGKSVEGEHPKDRAKRGAQNSELESHGDESRPAIQRPAANIQGIRDDIHPILESETAEATSESSEQSNKRHHVAFQSHGFGETLDGEGSVGVHAAIARLACFFHGMNELLGSGELRHHAVDV